MNHLDQSDWKHLFLSFEGRISRRPYWIGTAVIVGASVVLSLVGGILAALVPPLGFLAMAAMLALVYPGAALCAKRWHDRGKSGWWTLINLVPFGCLYALYELGFAAGVDQHNSYGANPLGSPA